jgi:hypothetical protein
MPAGASEEHRQQDPFSVGDQMKVASALATAYQIGTAFLPPAMILSIALSANARD